MGITKNPGASLAQRVGAQRGSFIDTMSKIQKTGKALSPRSQRLLGGLSGDQYKDIKADHIPRERERIDAAKAKKLKDEADAKRIKSGAEEEEAEEAGSPNSPTTIIRRARRTSMSAKVQMAEVQTMLASTSKLLANQFRGMSERKLRERIRITFDTYDVSGDGFLQVSEVHDALTGLGQTLTLVEAQEFVRLNVQGDGNAPGLTISDFETVVRTMLFGDATGISRISSAGNGEAAAIIAAQEAAGSPSRPGTGISTIAPRRSSTGSIPPPAKNVFAGRRQSETTPPSRVNIDSPNDSPTEGSPTSKSGVGLYR